MKAAKLKLNSEKVILYRQINLAAKIDQLGFRKSYCEIKITASIYIYINKILNIVHTYNKQKITRGENSPN